MARSVASRTAAGNRRLVRDNGSALQFDGISTVVTKLSQTACNLANFSLSFWIQARSLGATFGTAVTVYAEGSTVSNNQVYILRGDNASTRNPDYKLRLFVRDDSNTTLANNIASTQSVLDGKIHHIAITDANGICKLYVDGVLDATNFNYSRGTLTLNRTSLGSLVRATSVNYIAGAMDSFRVFSTILSQSDVTELYYRSRVPSGCILEYLFSEGSGTTINDTSGSGNNATVTNPVWQATSFVGTIRAAANSRTLVL